MAEEQVILVNSVNQPLGLMAKLEAHEKGYLHRAVSCFLFSSKGELLIQRRAVHKYHSGGHWANTCCSHPHEGETAHGCITRRLYEEFGIETSLAEFSTIQYQCEVGNGLTENEYVHGFVGIYDGVPAPNCDEISEYMWVHLDEIERECDDHLAGWFRKYIETGFLKEAFASRYVF